jgi:GDP-4-dehydro-6-deoxy-D-mannose reductase
MTDRVLVTGAAGFVGSHLVEALQAEGATVVAWQRRDVELLDRNAVHRAITDVQPAAVYHMAGSAHVAQSWQHVRETYEGNVRITHYLLDAIAGLAHKPRVLVPCTAHVYAPQPRPIREDDALRPASPYATSKLAVEMLAERAWIEDQVPTIIARSFNHVGPRQPPSYVAPSIARQIAVIEAGGQDPVLTMGSLAPRREFTDVRDTVRAYMALMAQARPAIRYNVASGRAITIGELVQAFATAAHCEVRVVEDRARFRPNDQPLLTGDNSRLVAGTGWQPRISLEQTVTDLLDYWRARVKAGA